MKAVLQALGFLVILAVAMLGANLYWQREYVKKSELEPIGDRLAAVQGELADLKGALADLKGTFTDFEGASVARQEIPGLVGEQLTHALRAIRNVDIDLGALPVGRTERLSYLIPEDIPATASEILVYAYIETGYVRGGMRDIRIAVRLTEATEAAFYLHAFAQPQSGRSYASANVWLPMPEDRTLRLESTGEPLFGDWDSRVKITAYR